MLDQSLFGVPDTLPQVHTLPPTAVPQEQIVHGQNVAAESYPLPEDFVPLLSVVDIEQNPAQTTPPATPQTTAPATSQTTPLEKTQTTPPALKVVGEVITESNQNIVPRPVDRDLARYEPRYIQEMIDFFNNTSLYKESQEITSYKDGEEVVKKIQKPSSPPSFAAFGAKIGISEKALKKWAKYIPEFDEAYELCQTIAKTFFIEHGLVGNYNSQFGIFAAKNLTDMQDKHINENRNVNMNDLLDDIEKSEKPLFDENRD